MRKNFSNRAFSFFLVLSLFLSACKTAQKAVHTSAPVILAPQAADSLFEKMLASQLRFTWLNAKTSVEYTDGNDEKTELTVNLRVLRDSVIWLSVTPLLGLEAARVLITRDSVHLLDRLHHTSMTRDYRYLEELLKTPITFELLQALLTGNYFSGVPGQPFQSVYEDNPYYILSTLPKMQELRGMEQKNPDYPVVQDNWIDTSYRIARSRVTDDPLHRQMTLEYGDFVSLNEGRFPLHIQLSIEAVKPSRITVRYLKYSFEGPLSFPFSIPEKYERQ